jgi:hypothetical protein
MKRALVLSLFVLSACGPQEASVDGADESFEVDAAPLLGGQGGDHAERACHVMLRSIERDGLNCSSTGCWWIFKGVLDVSETAIAEGVKPYVLVKNLDASAWTKWSATKSSGAPAGFVRYTFRATRNTITDGMSATSYQRAYVEFAPYGLTKNGGRVFDHNRNADAFTNYRADLRNGWKVPLDESTCGAKAALAPRVAFSPAWQTTQQGALVAGQPFVIDYAISRLETCRGTHNGYPAWDVRAFVRFSPSGVVSEGTVRGFNSPTGTPSNAGAVSVPLTLDIPSGTTSLELWFRNDTGAGSSCVAWDSNLGANYVLPVAQALPAAVQWEGNAGSSFNRSCWREDGVPQSVTFDSYLYERACTFVDVDVYVPGLTDGAAQKPWEIWAQTELVLDGKKLEPRAMTFQGRVGNDYRFRFELPKQDLFYGPKWTTLSYAPRFSTDGRLWKQEPARTVTRDASFCNAAWGSCAP